jgi:asparagine synthase (glutamine-hydrolysing)
MPGLVGLISRKPRAVAEAELRTMLAAIQHEPFYETAAWIDESSGTYAGLSALKHSFAAGGPHVSETGDLVLLFSGEEFSPPETVDRLKRQGHAIGSAPGSYLVHLAEEEDAFPAQLNGTFHGLLHNRATGATVLFNDRYGLRRLYYHQGKDAFYFAAEAKAILAVCPEARSIAAQALADFISCGCTLENRTFFDGVHALPGGAAWRFCRGALASKAAYFEPQEWEHQPALTSEEFYDQLRHVFTRNLSRYFTGNERVAVSLTGGLDTRMIMAWHKPAPRSLPCYTFGGMLRDSHDVLVARQVARLCEQTHEVIALSPDFLSHFARYAERTVYLSDGCADVGRAPDLFINERARTIAPIRMTGNYGSEVLRGVRGFKPRRLLPGLFNSDLLAHVQQAEAAYARLSNRHPLSFIVFGQLPWHQYGVLALEETQVSMRTPYLDNDLVRTVFRAPRAALSTDASCVRLIADGSGVLARLPTDRGNDDTSSLKSRARTVLRNASFKAEYAYDLGMPNWAARIDHLIAPLRPGRLFLGRHKFAHFRVWYRDSLATYVRDMLLDRQTLSRPYTDRRSVEFVVSRHLSGSANYTLEIHKLLTLELLHRTLLESSASAARRSPTASTYGARQAADSDTAYLLR